MELKVTFKDGEKSRGFKFGGDPAEIIEGVVKQLGHVCEAVGKMFEPSVSDESR
jgi:hypothetical protein